MDKKVDLRSLEFDDVYTSDAPDFSDAYVSYAEWEDGTPLTDDELEAFSDKKEEWYNQLLEHLH